MDDSKSMAIISRFTTIQIAMRDTLFEQSIQKMLDKSGTRRRPNITRKRLKTFFGASPRGIAKFSSNQNNWKKLKWKR